MFHANTPQHNKEVILNSLTRPDGVVRVVFATVTLGVGINFRHFNTIIHYGAPQSIEDYFQGRRRGERCGESARSIVYWKPIDCHLKKQPASVRNHEVASVHHYLENDTSCGRQWLLQYFDPSFTTSVRDPTLCCDICASTSLVCYFLYLLLFCLQRVHNHTYALSHVLHYHSCLGLMLYILVSALIRWSTVYTCKGESLCIW